METVDLTKAAGFQAVDSEGNVLGTVSMDQLTDSIASKLATELSTQNSETPVMRTMSAATTMAATTSTGSDKMENAFTETTDPAYVRVIDKSGNSAKQGIASLASVVGGLLNIYGEKNWSINNGSFDDMPTGFFYGNYNTEDWDSYNAPFQYGHVTICINNAQSGLQISLPETSSISNSIYFRRKWSNMWSEWKHSIGE